MIQPRRHSTPEMSPADKDRLQRKLRTIKAYKSKFGGNDDDTKFILADLRKRCGVDATPYFPNCGEGHLAFMAGLKAVFLHIKNRTDAKMDEVRLTPEDQ